MEKIQVKPFSDLTGREVFCLSRIRDEVFVAEQGITVPELDDQDLAAYHVYLLNEQETDALAAARFFEDQGRYYIGRVAVQKAARRKGLASQLLSAIESYVLDQQLTGSLYLHAQVSAKQLYLKNGYEEVGTIFEEAGIPHQLMEKKLH
jgi:ElaA protein